MCGSELSHVTMTFHQQPKNPGIVIDTDQGHPIRSHRRYRDRPRVVGVILLRPARSQHPNTRCQHRGNIEHCLTGRDKLPCNQIAEPVG